MISENNLLTFFNSSLYDGTKPLTKQEVIYKVVEKLNLVILNFNKLEEITQGSITELKKQVNYYLDDGMKIELQKIINEMVTDGTFDTIINESLFSELNQSIEENTSEIQTLSSNFSSYKVTNNNIINEHITEFKSFKTTVNDFISAYNEYKENTIEVIKTEVEEIKEMNNTVKTVEELRTALTKGGVIYIEQGDYYIPKDDPILYNSFTKLIGKGQVIFYCDPTASNYIMFKPNLTGLESGYALRNIDFENIIFDGQNASNSCGLVATCHSKYVTFNKCEFRNLKNKWHLLELNSSKNVDLINCEFHDYNYGVDDSNGHTEAVQLDFSGTDGQYPFTCLYDNTKCVGITFDKCEFYNITTSMTGAIGSHTVNTSYMPEDVTIQNCNFHEVDICIYAPDYLNLICDKNKIYNCATFLVVKPSEDSKVTFSCTNNRFVGTNKSKTIGSMNNTPEGRFIFTLSPQYFVTDCIITGNIISNCYSHGIGITALRSNICNNDINFCGKHGLYIYGGQQIAVTGNTGVGNGSLDNSTYHDLYVGVGSKGDVIRSNISNNSMYCYTDGNSYTDTKISNNL